MDLAGLPDDQLAYGYVDALERQSHALNEARKAEEAAGQFRAELGRRLTVGEVVIVDDETMVVMEPAKPNGRRSVNRDAIHRFIETLGPLGLGPTEKQTVTYQYPTVAELERRAAVLYERHGIALEELVDVPPLGEPQIVVKQRTREATA